MSNPEIIYNVSQSQFSIARHYGGITFNGASYRYNPENDTLTREDIWLKNKTAESKTVAKQGELPLK